MTPSRNRAWSGVAGRHSVSITYARLFALAICVGFGLAVVIANVHSWELEDADAYWRAALRLRDGQPLYVAVAPNADEMLAYRYAPWFAWAWVPLSFLPKPLVQTFWSITLVAATGAAVYPLVRFRTTAATCLAFLLGAFLLRSASTGNVQPLLIAALVWGLPRRSGPIWLGLAASLKFVPIIYVLPWLARRQWRRAGLATFLTVILMGPMLLYDLSTYPTEVGESLSVLSNLGLLPYLITAGAAIVGATLVARGRWAWLGASTAVLATVPRLDYYDLTYLLIQGQEVKRATEEA